MDGGSITLRRVRRDDERGDPEGGMRYVETLLERNDLPADDVRTGNAEFYLGYDGDERVGVGGIEPYGTVGLLRSVVVERSDRDRGLGTALCDALEAEARADGIATLYLLTTTAADFFADRGYARIERGDAPDAIRATTEFDELCPSTATPMRKRL